MRSVVFIYGHGCQSGCRVRLKADAGRSLRPKFLKCLALVQGKKLPIKSEKNSSHRTSSVGRQKLKLAEIPLDSRHRALEHVGDLFSKIQMNCFAFCLNQL